MTQQQGDDHDIHVGLEQAHGRGMPTMPLAASPPLDHYGLVGSRCSDRGDCTLPGT
jgi:hypothetical protein